MANKTVTILYADKPLTCRGGTSVAVALFESGIRVLSHSPKYGRPRGLHCARGYCTGCLMRIDGAPNVRACLTEVRDGMRVERQDTGAFYGAALQRALEIGGNLLPVGFYFKWFTRPALLSRIFLRWLRPLTGSGRLPDPDRWTRSDSTIAAAGESAGTEGNESAPRSSAGGEAGTVRDLGTFDSVVLGAGLSGLSALRAATGRTLLVDENPGPGGQRWPALAKVATALGPEMAGLKCLAIAHRTLVEARPAVDGATADHVAWNSRLVAGYAPDHLLLRAADGELATLHARRLYWMAGGLDSLGLFAGNDLPGLFGPRGLYRLLVRDRLEVSGLRAVVFGSGLDLWLAAALLHVGGAQVAIVPLGSGWPDEVNAAIALNWQLHAGLRLANARSEKHPPLMLNFAPAGGRGSSVSLSCDLAVISGPGKPVYDIPYQLGAELVLEPSRGGYVPSGLSGDRLETTLPGGLSLCVAGEAAGQSAAAVLAGPAEEVSP